MNVRPISQMCGWDDWDGSGMSGQSWVLYPLNLFYLFSLPNRFFFFFPHGTRQGPSITAQLLFHRTLNRFATLFIYTHACSHSATKQVPQLVIDSQKNSLSCHKAAFCRQRFFLRVKAIISLLRPGKFYQAHQSLSLTPYEDNFLWNQLAEKIKAEEKH